VIALAHGTLLQLSPPDLIRIAARVGYDAVGLRVLPWRPGEARYNLRDDPKLLAATQEALQETGLTVLDVEVLRIEPQLRAAEAQRCFDLAKKLGARYVLAVGIDPDEPRLTVRYAELCAQASHMGLRVVLEFLPRTDVSVKTLDVCARIVQRAGFPLGGVLVDTAHFFRSGADPKQLAKITPALLPYYQLADAQRDGTPRKLLPGEGDLPLASLVRALPGGIPVSVEVGSEISDPMKAEQFARRAFDATQALLRSATAKA
jgi:sugar phosphate isomerase/epimerase